MKKQTFKGTMIRYEILNNSSYGNPRYLGVFEDSNGNYLIGKTGINASCGYSFLNNHTAEKEIQYHVTKTGNVVIDYITIEE